MGDPIFRGTIVEDCFDCHGTGRDPVGNMCPFCDGYGATDEREDEMYRQDGEDEDELVTPAQKETRG